MAKAQDNPPDVQKDEIPLEDMLDLLDDQIDPTTRVADRVAREARSAPALVTVLTGEEIERLGARDLMDALRLLPSVEFGSDVWNSDSLLIRGMMGSDGRVLLIVDGHEWNETVYGFINLANRLPATLIEQIEVIRGPGSAVYGGYAMIGVIRVTTKAQTANGARIDARASWLDGFVYGRQDVNVIAGGEIGRDGHIGMVAAAGRGRRSADDYVDVFGNTADLTDGSALDPTLVSSSLSLGTFEASLSAESYRLTFIDGSSVRLRRPHESWFSSVWGRSSWRAAISDRSELSLRLSSKWQEPWRSTSWPLTHYNWIRDRTDRTVGGIDLVSSLGERTSAQAGAEAGLDRGFVALSDVSPTEPRAAVYGFAAGWGQGTFETAPVEITAGARFDASSAFGQAVSPRLALGQAWRRFHYKVAANRAFRAPSLAHARSRVDPEQTSSLEAEAGVGPTAWSYLTASVYRNWLTAPMVYRYTYDEITGEESEGYFSGTGLTTSGLEIDAQILTGPFTMSVGWAGVSAEQPQEDWAVPGRPARVLSAPAHRAVGRLSFDPGGRLTLGAVVTAVGDRWALTAVEDSGALIYRALPPSLVLDLSARVRHVGVRGLSIGASIHDLFDVNPLSPQGYWAQHAPTPGTGRELLLQLTMER